MKILKLISPDEFSRGLNSGPIPSVKDRVSALTDWVRNQKFFDVNIVSSQFSFFEREYSHYLVTLKTLGGKEFTGHGRAEDPYLALLKGFSEAFERAAMSFYFQTTIKSDDFIQLKFSGTSAPKRSQFPVRFFPTARMRNSNGWAVHSDPLEAAKRGLYESLERHSLQLRYWDDGLTFLRPEKSLHFGDYRIELSSTEAGLGQLQTLIAVFKSSSQPGMLFGHTTVESIDKASWIHPMIEAYQIGEALKYSNQGAPPENIFDEIQQSFWFSDQFKWGESREDSVVAPKEMDVNVVGLNLKEMLDLPFSLFACWTFSDSIMPLFLERLLSSDDRTLFAEQFRFITNRNKTLFQTPFI